MKIIIQKIFNLFGYRLSSIKTDKIKNFDEVISKIFKKEKLNIIDIGANTGQSIKRFQKLFNNSKIYSIEPSKNAFNELSRFYSNKKNIFLFNFAIGIKNEKKIFFDYQNNVLSSFYKLNKLNKSSQRFEKQTVKVLTLDKFCKKNKLSKVHILKIDTQGNETKVLKGASKCIKKEIFSLIEVEIIMGDYYENSLDFYNIEKNLFNNYRMIAIDKKLNLFNDKRMYCNALYIKKSLYKKLQGII
tara:strand:+ start:339 stop:1070 length:732 start_codon:yes stop_codon:yes gene_type:complete